MTAFFRKNNQNQDITDTSFLYYRDYLYKESVFEAPLQFLPGTDYANYMDKVYSLSVFIRVIRA